MIIDAHVHIGRWSEIFFNYESTVSEAIEVFKSSGVEAAVVMPADKTSNSELLKEVKNRKDFRFYFKAWINPEDAELDSFLEKNLKDISLFKIHPSIQRKRITDESYTKYLKMAAEHKIPVVVHCGRWQEIASYEFCLEVSRKIPELVLILAHMGGDAPSIYLKCADELKTNAYPNVYLGTESVREFAFMKRAVKLAGPDKVIFGSDYNLCLPRTFIPIIDALEIPSTQKDLIFAGNILKLLEDRKA